MELRTGSGAGGGSQVAIGPADRSPVAYPRQLAGQPIDLPAVAPPTASKETGIELEAG